MASQRATNTMDEFLRRMISDLAIAKTLPDADLQFLIGIETTILQKLREPVDQMSGQTDGLPADPAAAPGMDMGGVPGGMPGGGGLPPELMGAMGGGPPGMATGPMPGPGVANVPSLPPMPNPDELRRTIAGAAG